MGFLITDTTTRLAPGGRAALLAMAGAALVFTARELPVRVGVVVGHSMEPALRHGQPFLYVPFDAVGAGLHRGDVILVRLRGRTCVKRGFALGGQRFWRMGTPDPSIDASRLLHPREPVFRWRHRFPQFRFRSQVVPARQVYVVGDGVMSLDSRHLGPVPRSAVLGRVLMPGGGRVPWGSNTVAWSELPSRVTGRRAPS